MEGLRLPSLQEIKQFFDSIYQVQLIQSRQARNIEQKREQIIIVIGQLLDFLLKDLTAQEAYLLVKDKYMRLFGGELQQIKGVSKTVTVQRKGATSDLKVEMVDAIQGMKDVMISVLLKMKDHQTEFESLAKIMQRCEKSITSLEKTRVIFEARPVQKQEDSESKTKLISEHSGDESEHSKESSVPEEYWFNSSLSHSFSQNTLKNLMHQSRMLQPSSLNRRLLAVYQGQTFFEKFGKMKVDAKKQKVELKEGSESEASRFMTEVKVVSDDSTIQEDKSDQKSNLSRDHIQEESKVEIKNQEYPIKQEQSNSAQNQQRIDDIVIKEKEQVNQKEKEQKDKKEEIQIKNNEQSDVKSDQNGSVAFKNQNKEQKDEPPLSDRSLKRKQTEKPKESESFISQKSSRASIKKQNSVQMDIIPANQMQLTQLDYEFQELVDVLMIENQQKWEISYSNPQDNMLIYRSKVEHNGPPVIMVKSIFEMVGIPKLVAFNMFCDLAQRIKWDKNFSQYTIIEENKSKNQMLFHYKIPMPMLMTPREVLLVRTVRHNFPIDGAISIHSKSAEHPRFPIDEPKTYRVETPINGMIITDINDSANPRKRGTQIAWVFQNDIKGSIPKAFLNEKSSKVPKDIAYNWIKQCFKFMNENNIKPI